MSGHEPLKEAGARSDRRAWLEIAVALPVLAVFLAGVAWWVWPAAPRGRGTETKAQVGRLDGFVGDRVCAGCHPGEAASHRRSGHSHTLQRADGADLSRRLDGRTAVDPESPETTWSFHARNGPLAVERRAGAEVERFVVDYLFGSGRHALTFMSLLDRDPAHPSGLELRMTYYRATDSFGVTPGQTAAASEGRLTAAGRVHSTAEVVHCFGCHASTTSAADPNVLDTATMIPNVACERCHGFGRSHVESARRGEAGDTVRFGVGRETVDQQMRLCGQCHRYPGVLEGLGVPQVHPSKIRPDNPEIVRFQPVGLMQSRCYRESQGRLSCVTCHDPHARASTDQGAYDAACLSCHGGPRQTSCRASKSSGCVGCHMPRTDAGQGVLFTDHWVRLPRGAGAETRP